MQPCNKPLVLFGAVWCCSALFGHKKYFVENAPHIPPIPQIKTQKAAMRLILELELGTWTLGFSFRRASSGLTKHHLSPVNSPATLPHA